MERPFIERRKALIQRDNLSKEEVVSYDIAHVSGSYKEKIKSKKVIKINNNQTKEELIDQTEKIYNDNFVPIRKRYKVEDIDSNVHSENKIRTSIREQGGR